MPKPPPSSSTVGRRGCSLSERLAAAREGGRQNRREMGMPVTAAFAAATPRATSRALVDSAATQ